MSNDYSTETSKWKAYQFKDPYADGEFVVGFNEDHHFCTPSCDSKEPVQESELICFLKTSQDALDAGFVPCDQCNPMNVDPNKKHLIKICIEHINKQINFQPPSNLFAENSIHPQEESETGGFATHASTANNQIVAIACRHIAAAAAGALLGGDNNSPMNSNSANNSAPASPTSSGPVTDSNSSPKKRRKRGGVVGFKELAAKAKLSAWHFHRVFKSIAGLTPKAYGDKCSDFMKQCQNEEWLQEVIKESKSKQQQQQQQPLQQQQLQEQQYPRRQISRHSLTPDESYYPGFSQHRNSVITTTSIDSQMMLDSQVSFSPSELDTISPITSYLANNSKPGYSDEEQYVDLEIMDYLKSSGANELSTASNQQVIMDQSDNILDSSLTNGNSVPLAFSLANYSNNGMLDASIKEGSSEAALDFNMYVNDYALMPSHFAPSAHQTAPNPSQTMANMNSQDYINNDQLLNELLIGSNLNTMGHLNGQSNEWPQHGSQLGGAMDLSDDYVFI
ncbi:hypothetical protein DASC09_047160 [Saccharomycopsis crataegensis]|uniref:Ada DNA repair metal-binding domain-containing protein n=1 Tax=Saccharomycopsis crataegensis TaxID=43959 RepID=A0AAV5QRM9_9ASCO|nr:hypothetical protein DASC09_047160 [Saccharomycopsis crataegensis]